MNNRVVDMRCLRSLFLLLFGCGSGAGSSTQAVSDASSPNDSGACVQIDSSTGNVRVCTEYLPGNQAIVPAARDACTGVINGYASHWDTLCPANPVNGCKYPPGTFGVPGVQVVWYYLTAGGCTTEGTTITPEGYTFADAGTS